MDGIVASTTTAIAARMTRITRHTIRTPAPTEWSADSEVAGAPLSQSQGKHRESWRIRQLSKVGYRLAPPRKNYSAVARAKST
jgi:hypothetical protein